MLKKNGGLFYQISNNLSGKMNNILEFKASYEIAVNSVFSKKMDRLVELQQQYDVILRYYPETLFFEELENKMTTVKKELEKLKKTIKTLSK